MSGEEVEAYRGALRRAVGVALAGHPPGSATVEEGVNVEHLDMRGLDITPVAAGAASAYVVYGGGDEVMLGFGETHVYLWDRNPEALAREVQDLLEAVFAGSFVEAGPKGDAMAKVSTARGEVRVGSIRLPLPWGCRRTRTYEPYSAIA